MIKDIKFEEEARAGVVAGINQIADAVKVTLGPRGRTVILEQNVGFPRTTKDGVSVAKAISLEDRYENIGANLIREVASQSDDTAGDGTTTATVLAQAIVAEGLSLIDSGSPAISVKRGIDKATEEAVRVLDVMALPITEKEQLRDIATISANGDVEIGALISDALDTVTEDGSVTLDTSATAQSEVVYTEGLEFSRGYYSPYFMTNREKQTAEYINPLVLCFNGTITNIQDLLPLMEEVHPKGEPLVLIVKGISEEVLNTLVRNRVQNNLNICVIECPYSGAMGEEFLDDICYLTNQHPRASEMVTSIREVTGTAMLGRAAKITVYKGRTILVAQDGAQDVIGERITQIRTTIEGEENPDLKAYHTTRLAKLTGKVAVVKIGGITELEVSEKLDRAEDALNACRAAREEGIIPGGGTALLKVQLTGVPIEDEAEAEGAHALWNALKVPFQQILINAGEDVDVIQDHVEATLDDVGVGYNVQTRTYENLIGAGIIDPVKVTKTALRNAASIAGLVLTTGAVVVFKDKEEVA